VSQTPSSLKVLEESSEMGLNMLGGDRAQDAIMVVFTGISIVVFVLAMALQDWGAPPGPPTTGPNDHTWGLWLTCYLKAVELLLMAWAAPGQGLPCDALSAGMLMNCMVYFLAGVTFQFYSEDSVAHSRLWAAWTFFQIAAGSFCAFAGFCFLSQQGKYQSIPSTKAVGIALALWTVLCEILWAMKLLDLVGVPTALNSTLNATLTMLVLVVLGAMGGAAEWSVAVIVSFVGLAGVLQFLPNPMIKSSQSFNNDGLAHNAMILYYVAVFGLLCKLAAGDGFVQLAGLDHKFANP